MTITPKITPPLRFPGFNRQWNQTTISKLLVRQSRPVEVVKDEIYREIGVRSHGRGIFHKDPIIGSDLGNKRVFEIVLGALVLNIVFAWEQAIAIVSEREAGFIASHRFPMYSEATGKSYIPFMRAFFLRPRGKKLLELASPGGAGRNKTLGQKEFEKLKIVVPERDEQVKIAEFLNEFDTKIMQLTNKKRLLEKYKTACIKKIFTQEIRFSDDEGKDYPNWTVSSIGEILDYEQPTKYLVKTKNYIDTAETPVLTAGKTFILGYTNEADGIFKEKLPVIIFDDFTTAFKFVNFPFKAKSSAMKIIKPKYDNTNMLFMYYTMSHINFVVGDHKRHWISEYQHERIMVPCSEEQLKISNYIGEIDAKIECVSNLLDRTKQFKVGLLQNLLI